MHRYFPHTPDDEAQMLATVGAPSLEALFASVPESCRRVAPLKLEALDEWTLTARAAGLANSLPEAGSAWVGAGSYHHHVPAVVAELAHRSEFYTAYTPYQPEMSQGTLQGIFEYQTLVSRLLNMDIANASMYDGATALAESALMACRLTKRHTLAVSALIHPHYRAVLDTYCRAADIRVLELPMTPEGAGGMLTDVKTLGSADDVAALLVQSPNVLGLIEPLEPLAEAIHAKGGLLVSAFTEALAYGLLTPPGSLGADIVCGEGQSFGIAQSFGGPCLGIMTTRKDFVRSFPGRLVGQTTDTRGNRSFVLTLSTREQHIRREKAVSNICSNAGLCAMTAAIYLSTLGGTGLARLASLNHDKAAYLRDGLLTCGFTPLSDAPFFNEFALHAPRGFAATHRRLQERGILFGLDLAPWYPQLNGAYLFCATETRTRAEIDAMLEEVAP